MRQDKETRFLSFRAECFEQSEKHKVEESCACGRFRGEKERFLDPSTPSGQASLQAYDAFRSLGMTRFTA
jgi:hypothetical protein